MVDDDRQVALALAVADLIDPDPGQPVEQIDPLLGFGGDALDDRADRPPRDPHQLSDRGLAGVDGQPRGLVFEVPRELRAVARPRNRADHHAVTTTTDARRAGLDEGHRRAEIQRAPTPPPLPEIKPRRPTPADPAAITLTPARPHRDDHLPLDADLNVLDDRPLQAQQSAPYPRAAHAASSSLRFRPSSSRNPRRHAACAPLRDSQRPTARAGAP